MKQQGRAPAFLDERMNSPGVAAVLGGAFMNFFFQPLLALNITYITNILGKAVNRQLDFVAA